MSVHVSSWAWKQSEKFDNPTTFLTLLALADVADHDGECYPKRALLREMIGVSNNGTVTRHLNKIIDMGLVVKEERRREDGSLSSNLYRLQIGEGEGVVASQPPPSSQAVQGGVVADQPPHRTTSSEPSTNERADWAFDPAVNEVWSHYLKVFQPPRAKLGPSRARGIKRALQEVQGPEDLCAAVDGLFAYRKTHRGDSTIETIWKTFQGTGSMSERIEFFISQAPRSSRANAGLPSADPAIVARHIQSVQRGFHYAQNPDVVEQAQESEEWLARHGIETVRRESDGFPIFPGASGAR